MNTKSTGSRERADRLDPADNSEQPGDTVNTSSVSETVDMKNPETFASTIGNITWLASMSAEHKEKPISWLEQVVFPALLLRQFKLYFNGKQPVAAIIFGLLSDEHKAEWGKTGELPHLDHWRSGENVVVFEYLSPFGSKVDKGRLLKDFVQNATNLRRPPDTSTGRKPPIL